VMEPGDGRKTQNEGHDPYGDDRPAEPVREPADRCEQALTSGARARDCVESAKDILGHSSTAALAAWPSSRGTNVEVRHQVSAGGVVVRPGEALELCLIRPAGRTVWALPKGWVEPGETHEAAALREIREETGIEGVIDGDLESIEYWFFSREDQVRIHKMVHFFLVRFVGGDTSRHDHEVAEAAWFSVERALDRMTYPNERQIVRKATALVAEAQGEGAPEP
jgi:8-oxo-dGTP diphosphatase